MKHHDPHLSFIQQYIRLGRYLPAAYHPDLLLCPEDFRSGY